MRAPEKFGVFIFCIKGVFTDHAFSTLNRNHLPRIEFWPACRRQAQIQFGVKSMNPRQPEPQRGDLYGIHDKNCLNRILS